MSLFAVTWPRGSIMNAPEKGKRHLLREGAPAILRSGSHAAFRKIAGEVLANMPALKKGASVLRGLQRSRQRRWR